MKLTNSNKNERIKRNPDENLKWVTKISASHPLKTWKIKWANNYMQNERCGHAGMYKYGQTITPME